MSAGLGKAGGERNVLFTAHTPTLPEGLTVEGVGEQSLRVRRPNHSCLPVFKRTGVAQLIESLIQDPAKAVSLRKRPRPASV